MKPELIVERWKKFVNEAAVTDTKGLALFINENDIINIFSPERLIAAIKGDESVKFNGVVGSISLAHPDFITDETPCYSGGDENKLFTVQGSAAIKGYGPLLYDIALIYARKQRTRGIISDRKSLSEEAAKIYNEWFKRGTGATGIKIVARKLDNYESPETPPEEDDCFVWLKSQVEGVDYLFTTPTRPAWFNQMIVESNVAIRRAQRQTKMTRGEVEYWIVEGGDNIWNKLYHGDKE